MKKIRYIQFLPLLLAPVLVMGESTSKCSKKSAPQKKKKGQVELPMNSFLTVGGNYTRLNLKPENESSFDGNLGGAHIQYEYRPENAFYGAVEFKWRQGDTHGSDGKREILDLSAAEKMGYTLVHNHAWYSTFYTGFGFRYLGQKLHPSAADESTFNGSFFPPFITTATSLKFDYYEFYFPLGVKSEYTFNSIFSLGLNFEWLPQAFSTVQIRPLGGAYWSLKNKLANFLVEMPFVFNVRDKKDLIITLNPFYERWQDGRTTAKTSQGTPLGLPQNTYNFYGFDVNLTYSF